MTTGRDPREFEVGSANEDIEPPEILMFRTSVSSRKITSWWVKIIPFIIIGTIITIWFARKN